MAKIKKKGLSEKVRGKKKDSEKKVNPFEVKVNKQKHDVLGRKMAKHDRGMPGISRSKAIKKRKETLLVEYKKRGKANKLVDKRFGEEDAEMSLEDKMLQRFALERQRTHEKSELFQLNEEEDLTHYGQSLSEIEKFEDPISSDSEDEDDQGKISAKIVAEEHFGGFMSKKQEDGKQKSWKERMEEAIAKSKKEKYDRKNEKQKAQELTDKLDKEWQDLRDIIAASKKNIKGNARSEETLTKTTDDFDQMVRELQFEVKGKATDRLKTEEEIAKEEAERLAQLESDRMKRMKGIVEEGSADSGVKGILQHRSADDLDDGFGFDQRKKSVRFGVQYEEGKLVEDDKEEEEEDSGDEESSKDGEESGDEEEEEQSEDEDGESEEEGSEEDAMERMSDLDSEEEDQEEERDKSAEPQSQTSQETQLKPEQFKKILKERKHIMEKARKELPFTFPAPEKYQDLLQLLEGHTNEDQITIIERIRKCHHPSLAEGNKEKLEKLFGILLEYYGDLAIQDPPQFELMERLIPHLYQLSQQSPLISGQTFQALIKDKQEEFSHYAEARGGRGVFPTLDVLMYLKLISLLFPTSDFHHPVVTPTMLFMSQLITQCPVSTRRDIGSGLFICSVFLEYVSFSKRYIPEVINFLSGVVFMAIKKESNKVEAVIPPFKPVGRNVNFLVLQTGKEARNIEVEAVKLSNIFSRSKASYLATDAFRVGCLYQAIFLLHQYAELYEDLKSFKNIMGQVKNMCGKLPIDIYPKAVKDIHSKLMEVLTKKKSSEFQCLVMQRKKPVPMKMYEPKVEEVFEGQKKRGGTREANEKKKLIHKHKSELKGAIREIKKDSQFIARLKLEERQKRDNQRKRKVKEIYAQLASQEGEYNKLKREKDRL